MTHDAAISSLREIANRTLAPSAGKMTKQEGFQAKQSTSLAGWAASVAVARRFCVGQVWVPARSPQQW